MSRTTLKVGLGAAQRPGASLGFDELNRFLCSHRFVAVLPMHTRQRRREFEANYFSFHYGCRIHGGTLPERVERDKRRISSPISLKAPTIRQKKNRHRQPPGTEDPRHALPSGY